MVQQQLATPHAIVGMFIAFVTAFQAVLGNQVHTFRVAQKLGRAEPARIRVFSIIHRNLGKILTALSLYNVWLGANMLLADESLKTAALA